MVSHWKTNNATSYADAEYVDDGACSRYTLLLIVRCIRLEQSVTHVCKFISYINVINREATEGKVEVVRMSVVSVGDADEANGESTTDGEEATSGGDLYEVH